MGFAAVEEDAVGLFLNNKLLVPQKTKHNEWGVAFGGVRRSRRKFWEIIILNHFNEGEILESLKQSDVLQCSRSAGLSINTIPSHFYHHMICLNKNHITFLIHMLEFIQ